jgi:hypothetical protein
MAVEISGTDQRLLTTYGTSASIEPTGRPTNSSALLLTISEIPVSQAENVINLAEDKSTAPLCRSDKLSIFSPY